MQRHGQVDKLYIFKYNKQTPENKTTTDAKAISTGNQHICKHPALCIQFKEKNDRFDCISCMLM